MVSTHRSSNPPNRSVGGNRHRRDAALRRVSAVNKTVTFASLAAVAILSLYFSRAFPGHVSTPTRTGPPVTAGTASGGGSPTGAGSESGGSGSTGGQAGATLSPPTSPPVSTQQPTPVVSGST